MAHRPNVLFFHVDNLGFGELSCYSGPVLVFGCAAEEQRVRAGHFYDVDLAGVTRSVAGDEMAVQVGGPGIGVPVVFGDQHRRRQHRQQIPLADGSGRPAARHQAARLTSTWSMTSLSWNQQGATSQCAVLTLLVHLGGVGQGTPRADVEEEQSTVDEVDDLGQLASVAAHAEERHPLGTFGEFPAR
jgi:hypothetical protein